MSIKKLFLSLFLTLCIFNMSVMITDVSAVSNISEGDFDYKVVQGKATVVKYWQSQNTSVTVPGTVQGHEVVAIGEGAFRGTNVQEVTLSEGIVTVEERAFYVCEKLTTINLPSSLSNIEAMAFANCFNLTNINLPKSLTTVDATTFSNCIGLKNMTVDSENPLFSAKDNVLYNKDKTELVICPNVSGRTSFEIPDTVKSIRDRAFYGCSYLTSVSIPDSVEQIGDEAFDGCSRLVSVSFGDGIKSIGQGAFPFDTIKEVRFFSTEAKENYAALFNEDVEITCLCRAEHKYDDNFDADCNNCEFVREIIRDITSTVYTVSNGYISKIPLETKAADFLNGINEKDNVKLFIGSNEVASNELVGTGMVLKLFSQGKEVKSVTVIVTGDSNGDGKTNITDMIAVKSHILKKTMLSSIAVKGADTSGDGLINITDFIQIKAFILKKGTIQPK